MNGIFRPPTSFFHRNGIKITHGREFYRLLVILYSEFAFVKSAAACLIISYCGLRKRREAGILKNLEEEMT
jgi:hypothetical protein